MAELRDANENPWYVLMTLYGEQDHPDPEVNRKRSQDNRRVWNAWACQGWGKEQIARAFANPNSDRGGATTWSSIEKDVKKRHKKEMETRCKENTNFVYGGVPDHNSKIDLSGLEILSPLVLTLTIFQKPFDCANTVFRGEVNFFASNFTIGGNFRSTHFERDVVFWDVDFQGAAEFRGAWFQKSTTFDRARFHHYADFKELYALGKLQFANAEFALRADFTKSVFGDQACFDDAKFLGDAFFAGARFAKGVTFKNAAFENVAYLDATTFNQEAVFLATKFASDANFNSATFTQVADFSSSNFEGPAKFVEAKFGVRGAGEVCRADFTEAAFAKVVSFREAEFASHYPKLEGTQFREGVVLSAKAAFWPDVGKGATELDKRATEQAKESCAALRHALAKQGLPEEEHFFFRREMGFAAQIGGWWQRLPYRLFGYVSNFGDSIAAPTVLLGGLWMVPALFYFAYFAWIGTMGDTPWTEMQAFTLSFANIFTFFGFQRLYFDLELIRALPAVLQLMGALQTVFALPLLFFLGLALRKRFRLR